MRGADADRSGAGGDGRSTILLADHDPRSRRQTWELLTRAGYAVHDAANGDDALALGESNDFDLALLEVELPSLSGYEVCRKLRAQHGDNLPIVFVSAHRTESFDRVAGLLVGASDYIVKPFAPDELLARLRALLSRSHRTSDGEGAHLTQREAEVLRHVAEGLSDRQIARELVISHKTVSTHVEHILGKLAAHTRAQAIAEAYRRGVLTLP